ncbi:MAG: hypothetical protein ACC682_15515 [Gemmatimonadota bacterium]
MTQLAAILLIVLQGASFMTPALCSHAADPDIAACEHDVALGSVAGLDAPDACDDCGMPNCQSMLTCTSPGTAVTADPSSSAVTSIEHAAEATSIVSALSRHPAPLLPPPRA